MPEWSMGPNWFQLSELITDLMYFLEKCASATKSKMALNYLEF